MSLIFCLILSVAQAGYLRMVGESNLQIRTESQTAFLSGSYEIKNDGDEGAYQVHPEIRIDGFLWKGAASDLAAGQGARWDLNEKLSELTLPVEGDYLLKIRKYYQDANGYKFGVPEISILRTPQAVVQPKSLDLQMNVNMDGDSGRQFRVSYTLKNMAPAPLEIKLDLVLPDEVRMSAEPGTFVLQPEEIRIGEVEFLNERALPGSSYVAYLTAEWTEKSQRRGDFANQSFQIPQPKAVSKWTLDQAFAAWWVWSMIVGLIAMWVFWIRPVKIYSRRK